MLAHERFAKRALKNPRKDTLAAARRRFLCNGTQSAKEQSILAPEGLFGEKRKSVKKNAALLHFLAFLLLDLIFGVVRGE